MTSKQRIAILADWWPKACETQHWHKADRCKRLQVVSQAVGREITSFNDLNNSDDIDKVKAHLGYLADNLKATLETLPADQVALPAGRGAALKSDTAGERRRIFWLIRKHSRALASTLSSGRGQGEGEFSSRDAYALAVARDRFHLVAGLTTLEDLSTPQLHQLMITLNARLQSSRRRADILVRSNASLTSEETFPDQIEFAQAPEPELVSGPF